MKILIAEDDKASRTILVSGLEKRGHEVVQTSDGEEAWQKMQEPDAPKLLLLDIMMPVMDGLELCKKIRSCHTWTQPYIIMLTSLTHEDDIVHGLQEAGADDYILKPYNFRELDARILAGQRILDMQSRLLAAISERKRAQEKLSRLNEEIEQVFHGTQDAMFLISVEGEESFRFIRNNQAHQTFTGISLETIWNKTPEELLGEELGRKVTRNYARCLTAGQPVSYEETLHLPSGERTWNTTLTPVFKNNKAQYIVGSSQDITQRKQLEVALKENERRLRHITDTMGEGLYVMDKQGVVTFVNHAASELLGYTEEEILGQAGHELFHVHNHQGKQVTLEHCPTFQAVNQGNTYRGEDYFQRRDKSIFPVEVIGRPMWENGHVVGSVNTFIDITHRRSIEESLRESEERFRITLENLPGAVFVHDRKGRFLMVNRAACQQTGYSREELLQMHVGDLDPQAPAREDIFSIWQNMESGQASMVESFHTRNDGSTYPVEVFINAITLDGQPALLAVAYDISQRKAAEERLHLMATTDELTGLRNRRHFSEAVRNELERAHRYQEFFSLLMLDIDFFKEINDKYGHGGGDEVLRHFARLLKKDLRQMDITGRVGGEEFSIILPHTDLGGAYTIAERLRQNIEATPAVYQGNWIFFTVSIGAASYQKGMKSQDEIFKMADNALYKAKSHGRNLVVTYENNLQESVVDNSS